MSMLRLSAQGSNLVLVLLLLTLAFFCFGSAYAEGGKSSTTNSTDCQSRTNPACEYHLGTFIYTYDNGATVYQVQFFNATTLHWKGLVGGDAGVSATETYVRFVVSDEVHLVNWKEATGIVVTQALNYKVLTVNAVIVDSGDTFILQGVIQKQNG